MIRLNQEKPVTLAGSDQRLKVLFKNAAHHVIFLRGDKDLDFRKIADVIDIARGAGVGWIALMTQ